MSHDALQLGLFDERNLFELTHHDYPGERLVACRNPALAELRANKRAAIEAEAALDGLYVSRSAMAAGTMDAPQLVRHYNGLAEVEQAFRSLKTVDLKIRPIHHRLETRVRAHILLCMLAYYVEWHLRHAWCELLFADEDQAAKAERDPVAPARRSPAAEHKVHQRTLADGAPTFELTTLADPTQRRAMEPVEALSPRQKLNHSMARNLASPQGKCGRSGEELQANSHAGSTQHP